ncbi:MAG: dTDP-4-dehydrorhamnose 3,5-epimerase family protein [Hyphomicrobiaceae bacterium]
MSAVRSSGRFDVVGTAIAGLNVLVRKPVGDARGSLERMFCASDLTEWTGGQAIAQINRTVTREPGAVRGLHFQYPPHAETKFVSCLRGAVFDIAVDIRWGSPTFLHWHGEILDEENRRTLAIPRGFAHGFQCLKENCELLYFHTAAYKAEAESALNVRDPRLAIAWPLPVGQMSERDERHPMLNDQFEGVRL